MKFVKISITLPEDLDRHAEKQAAAIAKERAGERNKSAYIRELILREMRKQEGPVPQPA